MADEELCKICKVHRIGDFFERSMCIHCGEPFCVKCINVCVKGCPVCKRSLGEKSDKSILRSLHQLEEKIKSRKISNPERIINNLYICIGGRYLRGKGCKHDLKKAEKYYKKATGPVADYNLYCIYYDQERDGYEEYLERAVKTGYPKALCTKALSLKCELDTKLVLRALEMRSALAKKELHLYFAENPEVTTTLGALPKESIELLRESVKGKYSDAFFEWAVAVQFGHIPEAEITREMSEEEINKKIDENARNSVMWYKLAAQQGHGLAMNNLGVIFKNGLTGDPPDLEQAHWWYLCAHNAECNHGTFGLGTIYEERGERLRKKRVASILSDEKAEEMKKEEEENYREAGRYYGLATQKNFTPAIFQLGFLMVTRRFPKNCLVGRREKVYDDVEMVDDGLELIKDSAMRGNRHAREYLIKLQKEIDSTSEEMPEEGDGEMFTQIYSRDETIVYPSPEVAVGIQT